MELASITAVGRDRSAIYTAARRIDLTAPTPADVGWLTQLAPDVVTVAGAIGWGHLPVADAARTGADVKNLQLGAAHRRADRRQHLD